MGYSAHSSPWFEQDEGVGHTISVEVEVTVTVVVGVVVSDAATETTLVAVGVTVTVAITVVLGVGIDKQLQAVEIWALANVATHDGKVVDLEVELEMLLDLLLVWWPRFCTADKTHVVMVSDLFALLAYLYRCLPGEACANAVSVTVTTGAVLVSVPVVVVTVVVVNTVDVAVSVLVIVGIDKYDEQKGVADA